MQIQPDYLWTQRSLIVQSNGAILNNLGACFKVKQGQICFRREKLSPWNLHFWQWPLTTKSHKFLPLWETLPRDFGLVGGLRSVLSSSTWACGTYGHLGGHVLHKYKYGLNGRVLLRCTLGSILIFGNNPWLNDLFLQQHSHVLGRIIKNFDPTSFSHVTHYVCL